MLISGRFGVPPFRPRPRDSVDGRWTALQKAEVFYLHWRPTRAAALVEGVKLRLDSARVGE